MKKLIAFFEIPAYRFPSLGPSIFTKLCWVCNFRLLNVKQRKWLVSRKKVKPSVLFLMLQISTFFLQRMAYLSISTVRILNKRCEGVLLKEGTLSFPKQRLRQTIKDGLPYSRIVKETGLASMLKNNR